MDLCNDKHIGLMDHRFLGIILDFPKRGRTFDTWVEAWRLIKSKRSDEARNLVNKYTNEHSEADSAELLQRVSLMEHETKHFHDMLLSPFGSHLLRAYWQVYFNWGELLSDLVGVQKVGIPFQIWVRASDSLLSQAKLPAPPDKFNKNIQRVTRLYDVIKMLCSQATDGISWIPILESAATNVQELLLHTFFGDQAVEIVRQSRSRNPEHLAHYYGANSELKEKTSNAVQLSSVANAIYFMCLCGDTEERERASPSWRFANFLEYMRQKAVAPSEENVVEVFSEFLAASGLLSIQGSMQKSQDNLERMMRNATRRAKEHRTYKSLEGTREELRKNPEPLWKQYFSDQTIEKLCEKVAKSMAEDGLIDYLKRYISIRRRFIDIYLKDPGVYHNPGSYLENFAKWPAAPLYFICIPPISLTTELEEEFLPNEVIIVDDQPEVLVMEPKDQEEIFPITSAMEARACFEPLTEGFFSFLERWIGGNFKRVVDVECVFFKPKA